MTITFANHRLVIVVTILVVSVAVLAKCTDKREPQKTTIKNRKGQEYAGTESCQNCHRAIYDSFIATRHYAESAPASEENIKGSFSPG